MTQHDFFDEGYPAGFFRWLSNNRPIYEAFSVKARAMAQHRKHYSARAIIHVIRYETDLRDSEGTLKINNNWSPGMARLFMRQNPEYEGFFKCRDSQGLDL